MSADASLKVVAAQEAELVFERFDENVAFELGLLAKAIAERKGVSIFVNVSRGLDTIFEFSMLGTTPANQDFGLRKRAVVNLMHFSSINFWLHLQHGFDFKGFMNLDERTFGSYGGSFPIRVPSAGVIGSLTISGLSDIDDQNFAVEVLNEYLGRKAPLLSK